MGSWADNFIDFTEVNNIQTFDKNFKHIKEKCLYCQINYAPIPEGLFAYWITFSKALCFAKPKIHSEKIQG